MQLEIKQSHIDKGKRGDCEKCPIALAVLDAFDNDKDFLYSSEDMGVNIELFDFSISILGRSYIDKGKYSKGIEEFIDNFDYNKQVIEPVTLILDLEAENLSLIHEI